MVHQLKLMGAKPIEQLPNRAGFKFRGMLIDGSSVPCEVVKDAAGIHRIKGEFDVVGKNVSYLDLVGWMERGVA